MGFGGAPLLRAADQVWIGYHDADIESTPECDTGSGGCSVLFDRPAGSRDCTLDASPIINDDIAREDAVRFHHQTAARRCARQERAFKECGSHARARDA